MLCCVALRCVALRCDALRCVVLCCVALRCVALCCVVCQLLLHCFEEFFSHLNIRMDFVTINCKDILVVYIY